MAPIPPLETTTGLPRSIGLSGLRHQSIVGQFDAYFNAARPDLRGVHSSLRTALARRERA